MDTPLRQSDKAWRDEPCDCRGLWFDDATEVKRATVRCTRCDNTGRVLRPIRGVEP